MDRQAAAKAKVVIEGLQASRREPEQKEENKILFIDTLFSELHNARGVYPRPERAEQLQKYHLCKICNQVYEFYLVGSTASDKDLLKDNLN